MQKPITSELRLKNSLSGQLVPLIRPTYGSTINWYAQGPTLSHGFGLEQARKYVCQDMVRRVLRDRFGYHVQLAKSVADVEEKAQKNPRQEARKLEEDFVADLRLLEVEDPSYLFRVSEYIPEIVSFVTALIEKGFAYEVKGTVYFDSQRYKAKFKSEHANFVAEQGKEGKRHPEDFLLWRVVKGKEQSWQSPWGKGQPSPYVHGAAIAQSVFGGKIDLLSSDLARQPAHVALVTAYSGQETPIKHVIQVGEFAQKEAALPDLRKQLEGKGARVFRLIFLLHRYDEPFNFNSDDSLTQANEKDKIYSEFFAHLRSQIEGESLNRPQKITENDQAFDAALEGIRVRVHHAFCDNINSTEVINQVQQAIKLTHQYLEHKDRKASLLEKAFRLTDEPLRQMGLTYTDESGALPARTANLISSFAKFRDEVRINSKSSPEVLQEASQRFKEQSLTGYQIVIDQAQGQGSKWHYSPKQPTE